MANDDWRAETQIRLKKSKLYCELLLKCQDDPSNHQTLKLIDDAIFYAYQRTKTILIHMGEFTLHDGDHLFRVLHLMERLLPADAIKELSTPEILLLILSAFFHDIGMAPDIKTVLSWKKIWDKSPAFSDENEQSEYAKFQRYVSSRPDQSERIESMLDQGDVSGADLAKSYLVTDYIRITHATRAREIIQEFWLEEIRYRDTNLTVEFSSICFSHNDDALALLELDKNYLCGPDTYACLPLVAVILRLADLLDFDGKRTPETLFSHLFVRHPISLKEWAKHRAVEAWSINSKVIQFHAKCKHPAIEASIHAFCDIIDNELSVCNNVLSVINEFNKNLGRNIYLQIPFKVDRSKIETQKDIFGKPDYLYRQSQFNLSKRQVIDLLMGTKLYGDPAVALRELLQNSIDACLLRKALEESWGNSYIPQINVKYHTENGEDFLEVIDNGTGMDQHIVDSYYSKVGASFYKSPDFYELKSQSNANFTPTSRFGIGILSTFMVADTLEVDTRRIYGPYDSSEPINLTIEGQESIFWIRTGKRLTPGTATKLMLRKAKNPWDRMTEAEFTKYVESVIPNPPFSVTIETSAGKRELDENTFKESSADSLRNHTWDKHENIQHYEIEFEDKSKGFVGSAIVAVLERDGKPVKNIDVNSKDVLVDGESYKLEKTINLAGDKIMLSSTSIQIDDDAGVHSSTSTSTIFDSRSKLSLHGIEVSTTLFPQTWNMQKNQVRLNWPLPMLLMIDICEEGDLDLNSARTQIIMSEKWMAFEENLAEAIFSAITKKVSDEYWNALVVLIKETKNANFLAGLARVRRQ